MPEDDTLPVLMTLDQIAAIVGAPDPAVLAALNPPESQDAFRAVGANMATERIGVDLRRILAQAFVFYDRATPEQRRVLRGVSLPFFAVAVDRALALEKLRREFIEAAQRDKEARVGTEAAVSVRFGQALTLRDQADTVLRAAIGTDRAAAERLAVALGTADSDESLALGLERAVAFGEALLADPRTAPRAAVVGVDAAYLDELRAEAAALRGTAREASGRLTARLAQQGALDTLDGLCLDLLSHLIHAFDAARERDSAIPRLVPQATRRLLGRRRKPAPTPAEPGPPTA